MAILHSIDALVRGCHFYKRIYTPVVSYGVLMINVNVDWLMYAHGNGSNVSTSLDIGTYNNERER